MLAIIADPEHAAVVRKMREELDANIGQEPVRLNDKHKIPYCEAVRNLEFSFSYKDITVGQRNYFTKIFRTLPL